MLKETNEQQTRAEVSKSVVERVVSVPAWISVDERLPTHIYSVLAYVVAGGFAAYGEPMKDIVCYNPKSGEWLQNVGDIGDEVVTVTHWMDLPDDPAH